MGQRVARDIDDRRVAPATLHRPSIDRSHFAIVAESGLVELGVCDACPTIIKGSFELKASITTTNSYMCVDVIVDVC